MDFSRFFVDRPIFAPVRSIIIFVAGLIAITLLPISEYPNVVPPSVQVRADVPGANHRETHADAGAHVCELQFHFRPSLSVGAGLVNRPFSTRRAGPSDRPPQ